MAKKINSRVVLLSLLFFVFIVSVVTVSASDSSWVVNELLYKSKSISLVQEVLSRGIQQETDTSFSNKTYRYEYGKIRPQIRNGEELNDYFKSLGIKEDFTFVLVKFNEENITEGEKEILENAGAKPIGVYQEGIYLYKFPTDQLETKTFDFIEWIELPKKRDKIGPELKNALGLDKSLLVKIEFYEGYTDSELKKINRYAKFVNQDDWEPEENKIYALVGPKLDENSVHNVVEVASFSFVRSVKLIDIKDKRKLDLFVNQSDFYEDKTLVNQPHAVCPWERNDPEVREFPSPDDLPKIINQRQFNSNEKLRNLNKDANFNANYEFIKNKGFSITGDAFEVEYSDGAIVDFFWLIGNESNDTLRVMVNVNSEKLKDHNFVLEINENLLSMYDKSSGTKFNLSDLSEISHWGENSCTGNGCILYSLQWFFNNGWAPVCNVLFTQACLPAIRIFGLTTPAFLACLPAIECYQSFSLTGLEVCLLDNCYFYPCQQDCDDQDGPGDNWNHYCNGNDVWKRKFNYDYYCPLDVTEAGDCVVNESSSGWEQESFYQPCDYGCSSDDFGAWCDPEIECYTDFDCPADGWVGSTYCNGGDVWQTYRDYYCVGGGGASSDCEYTETELVKDYCGSGSCSGGECTGGSGECA
ncbi:MAG: hypothetical protein ABH864_03690 [archaeon]